ncbi:MAG TPA: imidazolonepropionase, partial [Actinomycetes bacterium]|nr:imidazolonepropionase [Actinomycetes bacterium]
MSAPGPAGPVDFLLTGAGQLVTCDPALGEGPLGLVERGVVAAAGGRVVYAGPEAGLPDLEVAAGATRVDAGGQAVIPGFVDAHTHLVFAGERADEFAARLRGVGYEEALAAGGGINRTVRETRA